MLDLRKFITPKIKAGVSKEALHQREKAYTQSVMTDDIPRYPPFAEGIPVVPPELLIETQKEMIGRISVGVGMGQSFFDDMIYPLISNFAEYVHLLPASEHHHHRGAGGLFRHSLEVAFLAMRSSENVVFSLFPSPSETKAAEARWRIASFVAGLLHDAGKPITDVTVVDYDGNLEWNIFTHPTLYQWAQENGLSRYYLRWTTNRRGRHERHTGHALYRLMPKELQGYLIQAGKEIPDALMEALTGLSISTPLSKLVIKSDSASVEKDLKEQYIGHLDRDSYGVAVERYIISAMRGLVSEGEWVANQPGSVLWVAEDGLYLNWRVAAQHVTQRLKRDNIPGIPQSPESLAEILLDRELAFGQTVPGDVEGKVETLPYWQIEIDNVQSAIGVAKVTFLGLKLPIDTLYVNDDPPPFHESILVVTQQELDARKKKEGEGKGDNTEAGDTTASESEEPTAGGAIDGQAQPDPDSPSAEGPSHEAEDTATTEPAPVAGAATENAQARTPQTPGPATEPTGAGDAGAESVVRKPSLRGGLDVVSPVKGAGASPLASVPAESKPATSTTNERGDGEEAGSTTMLGAGSGSRLRKARQGVGKPKKTAKSAQPSKREATPEKKDAQGAESPALAIENTARQGSPSANAEPPQEHTSEGATDRQPAEAKPDLTARPKKDMSLEALFEGDMLEGIGVAPSGFTETPSANNDREQAPPEHAGAMPVVPTTEVSGQVADDAPSRSHEDASHEEAGSDVVPQGGEAGSEASSRRAASPTEDAGAEATVASGINAVIPGTEPSDQASETGAACEAEPSQPESDPARAETSVPTPAPHDGVEVVSESAIDEGGSASGSQTTEPPSDQAEAPSSTPTRPVIQPIGDNSEERVPIFAPGVRQASAPRAVGLPLQQGPAEAHAETTDASVEKRTSSRAKPLKGPGLESVPESGGRKAPLGAPSLVRAGLAPEKSPDSAGLMDSAQSTGRKTAQADRLKPAGLSSEASPPLHDTPANRRNRAKRRAKANARQKYVKAQTKALLDRWLAEVESGEKLLGELLMLVNGNPHVVVDAAAQDMGLSREALITHLIELEMVSEKASGQSESIPLHRKAEVLAMKRIRQAEEAMESGQHPSQAANEDANDNADKTAEESKSGSSVEHHRYDYVSGSMSVFGDRPNRLKQAPAVLARKTVDAAGANKRELPKDENPMAELLREADKYQRPTAMAQREFEDELQNLDLSPAESEEEDSSELTCHDLLKILVQMIRAKKGRWIVGHVRQEEGGLIINDAALTRIAEEYPEFTVRSLRDGISKSQVELGLKRYSKRGVIKLTTEGEG